MQDGQGNSYGIILLAAGASARLGKPKQLLEYGGKTLLEHSIRIALDTGVKPVVLVLGANAGLLQESLASVKVETVVNDSWEEGMASSIRCGLQKFMQIAPQAKAVLLMVCDQPFVTSETLTNLVKKYNETGKPIVASRYAANTGTPALFGHSMFDQLLALEGDAGAKRLMKENPGWVYPIDFPLGNIDIDTEPDYEQLLAQSFTLPA